MKSKYLGIILMTGFILLVGFNLNRQSMKPLDGSNADRPNDTLLIDIRDLPDITRIEGIGNDDEYAYFLFRKGTRNYLGKIRLSNAIEVTSNAH
jgi:hypothetical protein